jgi:uncharacterized protein involved in propanediol utilization
MRVTILINYKNLYCSMNKKIGESVKIEAMHSIMWRKIVVYDSRMKTQVLKSTVKQLCSILIILLFLSI